MKQLVLNEGGYFLKTDELIGLENESLIPINALFKDAGIDFVLSGVVATPTGSGVRVNITAGIVYINNTFMRFAGVNDFNLANGPWVIGSGAAVLTEERVFSNGSTQNIFTESSGMMIKDADYNLSPGILIDFDNLGTIKRFDDVLAEVINADRVTERLTYAKVATALEALNEDWKRVGVDIPYDIVLQGGENPEGTSFQFRKDIFGRVYMRGIAYLNGRGGQSIFTLPVGYRPPIIPVSEFHGDDTGRTFIILTFGGGNTFARVIVASDGTVTFSDEGYQNYDIGEISFTAAPSGGGGGPGE